MKCVELFCGIGGFRIACDENNIETIWSNDNDEYASEVYKDSFGKKEFKFGDIAKLKKDIPKHDLLTAGFPCQPFSSAGKKLGVDDTRGTHFKTIVEILMKIQPSYFILENVNRMLSMDNGKHFKIIINSLMNIGYAIEWKVLNAINFGLPQNRKRVIIIGRKKDPHRVYLLKRNELDKFSDEKLERITHPLTWEETSKRKKKFAQWGLGIGGNYICEDFEPLPCHKPQLLSILEESPSEKYFHNSSTAERIKTSIKVGKFINGVEVLYNQKGGARMGYTIFGPNGVASTVTSSTSRHYERYKIGNDYRRLTHIEYARLQGFPDSHCKSVPIHKHFKLYGKFSQ